MKSIWVSIPGCLFRPGRLSGLVPGRRGWLSLRADCLRAGGLHHRRDVRHRGQEAVQRRGLQGHLPESAHLRAGGHRQPGGRVCAALLISQAVRLIWPGLSGKCGPAVRRKRLFAALYLNEKLLKVFLS